MLPFKNQSNATSLCPNRLFQLEPRKEKNIQKVVNSGSGHHTSDLTVNVPTDTSCIHWNLHLILYRYNCRFTNRSDGSSLVAPTRGKNKNFSTSRSQSVQHPGKWKWNNHSIRRWTSLLPLNCQLLPRIEERTKQPHLIAAVPSHWALISHHINHICKGVFRYRNPPHYTMPQNYIFSFRIMLQCHGHLYRWCNCMDQEQITKNQKK